MHLTDSDDASVGNEELNRVSKDGIFSFLILLLFYLILSFVNLCVCYCLE